MLLGLDHVSVLVGNLDRSLGFYQGVLGLARLNRPDLGFDGAWLDLGGGQSIHLLCLPNPDAQRCAPEHVGRDRHVAFRVGSTESLKARLDLEMIPYTLSQSGRNAVFCRDPDGNGVEFLAG